MKTKIYIEERLYANEFALYGRVTSLGSTAEIQPAVVSTVEEGTNPCEFLRIDRESIQDIFDQLWMLGFRPHDGTGNGGHIAALKYHLEDMRDLVFKREK